MGSINRPTESVFHEFRHPTGMVNMGMRENKTIDTCRIKQEGIIEVLHVFIITLIQSTIEQNGIPILQGQ